MKKVLLTIACIIGFFLAVSESETFYPNLIGLVTLFFSCYKLRLFTCQQ